MEQSRGKWLHISAVSMWQKSRRQWSGDYRNKAIGNSVCMKLDICKLSISRMMSSVLLDRLAVMHKLFFLSIVSFSSLTLLCGWQEGHPACKTDGAGHSYFGDGNLNGALHILIPVGATTTTVISCCSEIQTGLPFWWRFTRVTTTDTQRNQGRASLLI